MDKVKLIQGLKELIRDRQCLIDETDPECVFKEDIKYLEEAIRIIEEAPEEQSNKINLFLLILSFGGLVLSISAFLNSIGR